MKWLFAVIVILLVGCTPEQPAEPPAVKLVSRTLINGVCYASVIEVVETEERFLVISAGSGVAVTPLERNHETQKRSH